MSGTDLIDDLSSEYETLLEGDEVLFDVAQIYFKENDGFLIRTADVEEAIGMHLVEEGIFVSFFDLRERDDGRIMAREKEGIAFSVDDKVMNRVFELIKNAKGRQSSGSTESHDADLEYLG